MSPVADEGTYFESMDEWLSAYQPPERECPQCLTDSVVSKLEAKLVFQHSTSHSYICSNCHIHE